MAISLVFSGIFVFHDLFVFGLASFQTAPGNDQRRGLFLRLRACDHALQFRIHLDESREKRTFRQLIEQRLSCSRRIASRAQPTSLFLKMSPSNCRSSTNDPLQLAGPRREYCVVPAPAPPELRQSKSGVDQFAPLLPLAAQAR